MSAPGFAKSRTFQFCFESTEALYVDHNRQRVLADVEGAGEVVIDVAPGQATLWVDGANTPECSSSFKELIIVNAGEPGASKISVACGVRPETGNPLQKVNEFHGCGWIVSSKSIALVDDISDGWQGMSQMHSIPVFWSASGEGLVVEEAPVRAEKLAEVRLDDPETLKEFGWQAKNPSKLFPLSGEGPSGAWLEGGVISHLNQGGFSFTKPEGVEGVVVRKLYDAFHGRQRARVLVNGEFMGWWFEPVENRKRRWRWAHFGFDTRLEEQRLEFLVDPTAGTPLWSVGRYEVWGLVSKGR